MRGKWVCELSELAGMGRRETETVKAAITRQVDTYRPPYARRAVDVPRRAVFVGTMNRDDFLQDGTGGRRFLPFRCGVADPRLDVHDEAAARARIGLVWAEIMQHWRESGGFNLALGAGTEAQLVAVRKNRACASMVAEEALGIDRARAATDRALTKEVVDILNHRCPGWVRVATRRRVRSEMTDYGTQRCWECEG